MLSKKNKMLVMTAFIIWMFTITLPLPSLRADLTPDPIDYDPLVEDIDVTVTIQKIRAYDKLDWQVFSREYIDRDSDPDFFVKVIINGQEFQSPVWPNMKYVYNPNWSASLEVPDAIEFVNITLQLWDANEEGAPEKLCDISPDINRKDVRLTYSLATGHWTGDDYLGDSSGYGRLSGCDDGSIYKPDCDAELWFNINQTDPTGDGIPYWVKKYQYHLDPTKSYVGYDPNNDSIPITWDWKWGYDPFANDKHFLLDPDHDGLNNIEEYLTSQWGSDPFRKDLFIELDQMQAGPNAEPASILPEGSKEMLRTAYDRRNIVYHIDDGTWNGTGSDMIPFDSSTDEAELDAIYETYFLHGAPKNWRLGVFHYGVVIYQSAQVNGNMFGRNRFQISSHGMEVKARGPFLNRDTVYASAYMHETGHTLSIWPIGGHNKFSSFPWQPGWWFWRPYKSCMNYGYMFTTVDYSDGSRGLRDFNDWANMDLTSFES